MVAREMGEFGVHGALGASNYGGNGDVGVGHQQATVVE
jgi:hypothetical protein